MFSHRRRKIPEVSSPLKDFRNSADRIRAGHLFDNPGDVCLAEIYEGSVKNYQVCNA